MLRTMSRAWCCHTTTSILFEMSEPPSERANCPECGKEVEVLSATDWRNRSRPWLVRIRRHHPALPARVTPTPTPSASHGDQDKLR
jgi:hypothetical protein